MSGEILGVLASLGDVVGGFSTAVAVYLGVREVNRWREQRHVERRGEVAAQALIGVRTACTEASQWAAILAVAGSSIPGPSSGKASAYDLGQHLPLLWRELWRVHADAYVHLDDAEQRVIGEAAQLLQVLDIHARWWKDASPEQEQPGVFRGLAKQADDLKKRAEETLLPVARYGVRQEQGWVLGWVRRLRGKRRSGAGPVVGL